MVSLIRETTEPFFLPWRRFSMEMNSKKNEFVHVRSYIEERHWPGERTGSTEVASFCYMALTYLHILAL